MSKQKSVYSQQGNTEGQVNAWHVAKKFPLDVCKTPPYFLRWMQNINGICCGFKGDALSLGVTAAFNRFGSEIGYRSTMRCPKSTAGQSQ